MAEVTKINFKGTVLDIRDADATLVSEEAPSASVTGIDGVVASKPTFYCAALPSTLHNVRKKDRLALFGIDDFIAAGLVPILFRNSTKKGYRGWHPYLSHVGSSPHNVTLVKEND